MNMNEIFENYIEDIHSCRKRASKEQNIISKYEEVNLTNFNKKSRKVRKTKLTLSN